MPGDYSKVKLNTTPWVIKPVKLLVHGLMPFCGLSGISSFPKEKIPRIEGENLVNQIKVYPKAHFVVEGLGFYAKNIVEIIVVIFSITREVEGGRYPTQQIGAKIVDPFCAKLN